MCFWLIITPSWVKTNISPLLLILFLNLKILLILHEPTWVSEFTATQNNQDLRPKTDTRAILDSGTFILTPSCNSSLSHWFLTQLRGTWFYRVWRGLYRSPLEIFYLVHISICQKSRADFHKEGVCSWHQEKTAMLHYALPRKTNGNNLCFYVFCTTSILLYNLNQNVNHLTFSDNQCKAAWSC